MDEMPPVDEAAYGPLEVYPTFVHALGVALRNLGPLCLLYLPLALASTLFLFLGCPTFAAPPQSTTQPLVIPPSEWVAFAGWLLFVFSFGSWTSAATFRAADEAVAGRPMPGFLAAYAGAIERVPAVIGTQLLYALVLTFGFIACFVPGLWLLVLFLPALPRVATRDVGPVRAMKDGKALVAGRYWKVVGYLVLVLVVVYSLFMPYFMLGYVLPHGEEWAYWTRAALYVVTTTLVAAAQTTGYVALHDRLELTRG